MEAYLLSGEYSTGIIILTVSILAIILVGTALMIRVMRTKK